MYVLGIWDGHDAGAALVNDNQVVYAANEERFTKRKLEIKFPYHSINAALRYAKLRHSDITHIAFTTTEFTKTLERVIPGMKENYYMFRRRKIPKPAFEHERHKLKYNLTSIGILPFCNSISSSQLNKNLRKMGFKDYKLHIVEHHTAHAATAAFTCHKNKALIITLDGLGDGLCGSASILQNNKLERVMEIKARNSIGIFYEQVTNLVGMRELEDEGKVMAMAEYSYPFDFEQNKFKDFFSVSGTHMSARYSPAKQYEMIDRLAWQMPREQVSYMAQQLLENVMAKLVSNVVDRHSIGDIAMAGGLLSNVKANMKIRNLENVKSMYVFPHMGDGGIALGAALYTSYLINGFTDFHFSAYLGEDYDTEVTEKILKSDRSLKFEIEDMHEHAKHAAELIDQGNYVFWFQGRMEYGPRALGDRSILAPSDSEEVKEKLNLLVKRREWFQPFAPSILEEEVERILEYDNKGYDRYMTSAYALKDEFRAKNKSVMHIDGTARAQMVGNENKLYSDMLKHLKSVSGEGMVLNTSFNIHGMPIVMSPEDAIDTMKTTKTKYMFMNGLFITNRSVK